MKKSTLSGAMESEWLALTNLDHKILVYNRAGGGIQLTTVPMALYCT